MTLPRESTAKLEEQQWYETNGLNGSHVGSEEQGAQVYSFIYLFILNTRSAARMY